MKTSCPPVDYRRPAESRLSCCEGVPLSKKRNQAPGGSRVRNGTMRINPLGTSGCTPNPFSFSSSCATSRKCLPELLFCADVEQRGSV